MCLMCWRLVDVRYALWMLLCMLKTVEGELRLFEALEILKMPEVI